MPARLSPVLGADHSAPADDIGDPGIGCGLRYPIPIGYIIIKGTDPDRPDPIPDDKMDPTK